MLGTATAVPAAATLNTATSSETPTSPITPNRPSRLRGLSYLRNYTQAHLHPHTHSRADVPPLRRTTSSPASGVPAASPSESRPTPIGGEESETGTSGAPSEKRAAQGRRDVDRGSVNPSSSTKSRDPEPCDSMTRVRSAEPTSTSTSTMVPSATPNESLAAWPSEASGSREAQASKEALPTIRFIPHIETRSSRPSLHFTEMSRTLRHPNAVVKVGRYSEKDNGVHAAANDPTTLPVGFKSKVVSRRHCEFWCTNGQWYIKDVKSSSGTFLNHVRLSPPGQESRPYEINDGDTVQLGIDFKGGEEVIFRCVKIRIECNRGWQKSLNAYNTSAHKRLLKNATQQRNRDSDAGSVSSSECSICLNPVAPCQALFVAPCSHVWHYKCVRNLIHGTPNYPNFLCPNCRYVADLEADVEPPEDFEDFDDILEEANEDAQNNKVGSRENRRFETDETQAGGSNTDTDQGEGSARSNNRPPTNPVDEELAAVMEQTSLRPLTNGSPSTTLPESLHVGASAPIPVAGSGKGSGSRSATSEDPLAVGSTTPTMSSAFPLPAGSIPEGPLTPRNDAGPFVLDGSAGRGRRGVLDDVVREEDGEGEEA